MWGRGGLAKWHRDNTHVLFHNAKEIRMLINLCYMGKKYPCLTFPTDSQYSRCFGLLANWDDVWARVSTSAPPARCLNGSLSSRPDSQRTGNSPPQCIHRAQAEVEMPAFSCHNHHFRHFHYGSTELCQKTCMWPCNDFREVQLIFIRCSRLRFYKQIERASAKVPNKSS